MKRSGGDRFAVLLATALGAGYSPVAPGTAGSLVAIAVAYLLRDVLLPWHFVVLAALAFGPAVWSAGVTARVVGRKDPGLVVIDEVVGQWLTVAGATAITWRTCLAAFLLFRLFDIWKPPPVRRLEALPGGLGINADDAMAGVYGALVLWLAGWFNLY
jgi:phosphatidylglycerophosphatase A